ncbi:MAG: ABC transporter substrate-binding protein [Arcicella sp.]|nr:ABC transporter substrate-binding protein [Arcicella sp.]
MLKRLVLALILLSVFQDMNAQKNASDYEIAYKKAQQNFNNNDFEKAQSEFASLCNNRVESPYLPYSFYFNALSSAKLQKYFEAKTTLKNLMILYPNWSESDEINYLLADIAFQEKNYDEAFKYGNSILKETLLDDVAEMKAHYVQQIQSTKTLSDLAKKFPNESILTEKRAKTPEIITAKPNAAVQIQKGYFNFGLLLPLEIENIEPEKTRRNQYALDLYQGMKMAKSALLKEGITVNVFTYDVANDADQMLELVNNQSFRKMDLLIGPLYANTNKIAMTYCEEKQIPIINPISNNKKLLDEYNLSFLAQPSTVTQAIKASDFVRKQPFLGRNTAIYYTDSENDSTMAESYRQQMQKIGYEIVKFEKILPYSDDIGLKLPEKKVSHIFMATSDKKAGLSMLSALTKKSTESTPLITTAEAFNASNLSNGSLLGREVYCIDPEFVDTEKPEANNFRKDYLNKYGVLPSYYAFHGYDMALFWGRLFGKYSTNIRQGLDSRDLNKEGYNFSGYNFNKAQDNQVLPITTFQGYKFVLVGSR